MPGEAAFGAGKCGQIHSITRLGIQKPVFLDRRVALQAQPVANPISLSRIVGQQRKGPRFDSEFRLRGGAVVGETVLRHASGIADHHGRPGKGIGLHHRFVEVIHMRRRGLRHINVGMHQGDLRQFLATLPLSGVARPEGRHFRVLTRKGGRRALTACIGIDLAIEHQNFDIHAGHQQAGERLKADIVHRAIAADHPEAPLRMALLVPAQPDPHRIGGGIFEQRVGPRHAERIKGIGGAERVTAGRGDNPHLVLSINKPGGGQN